MRQRLPEDNNHKMFFALLNQLNTLNRKGETHVEQQLAYAYDILQTPGITNHIFCT